MKIDNGVRGWIVKTARKNYWRVAAFYDLADLIQDGYLHYCRIVNIYEVQRNRVRSRARLMGLFKIAYINHIHDLAKQRTRLAVEVKLEELPPLTVARLHYGATQDLLAGAPPLVRLSIAALQDDRVAYLMSQPYVRTPSHRETMNERLCGVLGLDANVFDLPGAIRSYFAGFTSISPQVV